MIIHIHTYIYICYTHTHTHTKLCICVVYIIYYIFFLKFQKFLQNYMRGSIVHLFIGIRLALQLPTSHSQRLNSGKPLGTSRCEWLWSIATWTNGCIPFLSIHILHWCYFCTHVRENPSRNTGAVYFHPYYYFTIYQLSEEGKDSFGSFFERRP